jgi:hypothetical protein
MIKSMIKMGDYFSRLEYQREVLTPRLVTAIRRLTYKQYLRKGYCKPVEDPDPLNPPELIQYPLLDKTPPTEVFTARYNSRLVGALSITQDFGELPLDTQFIPSLERHRKDLKILWRLVHESSRRGISVSERTTALGLLNYAIINEIVPSVHLNYTYAIEVNPRHVGFYRLIGFHVADPKSPPIIDEKVGAPGVLMISNNQDNSESRKEITKRAQKKSSHGIESLVN